VYRRLTAPAWLPSIRTSSAQGRRGWAKGEERSWPSMSS
jgi:hypothetical protein